MSANDRRIPSDAPCPGIGEAPELSARDRIVSAPMMGSGAFILLKVGVERRETTNQAEIRIATLLKILRISPSDARKSCKSLSGLCRPPFPRNMANSSKNARFCYLDHSLGCEIRAVSCQGAQDEVNQSISGPFYTQ
jgi:hypothetical protein